VYKTPNDEGLKLNDIVNRIKGSGCLIDGFNDIQEGIGLLERNFDGDSVVLALSSGGFDGLIDLTVKWLEENYKK
jgi:hypothetical protein